MLWLGTKSSAIVTFDVGVCVPIPGVVVPFDQHPLLGTHTPRAEKVEFAAFIPIIKARNFQSEEK